jgi:hypothetical protein
LVSLSFGDFWWGAKWMVFVCFTKMGTTAASHATSVRELSDKDLSTKSKADDEYALILSQIWDPTFLMGLKDMDDHTVPAIRSKQSTPGDAKTAEIAAAILQGESKKRSERLESLKSEL